MTERTGTDDVRNPHGMALDQDGFLGRAGDEARTRVRAYFSEHFEMAYAGNRVSECTTFAVPPRDGQRMTGAALLTKLQVDIQSVILNAERGMGSPAVSMLRVAFEALVLLTLVAEDSTFWKKYLESHAPFSLKSLRYSAAGRTGAHLSDAELVDIRRVLSAVGRDLKALDAKPLPEIDKLIAEADRLVAQRLSVPRLSNELALMPKYFTLYGLGNQEIHSTPASIRHVWLGLEAEEVTGFHVGPRTEDLPLILVTATGTQLAALQIVTRLFDDVCIPGEVRAWPSCTNASASNLTAPRRDLRLILDARRRRVHRPRMSADDYRYETHLTPKGWVRGDRPSDAVETWSVRIYQRSAFSPEEVTRSVVWTDEAVPEAERARLRRMFADP